MTASVIDDIPIIDVDTHVVEPYDLWTSRMSTRWGDLVPGVRFDEDTQTDFWFFGEDRIFPAAAAAQAGWTEYPPDHPLRLEDADPATWDVEPRLALMDDWGIKAQLLYPNVALFNNQRVLSLRDAQLQLDIVTVYNDWQSEWSAAAPDRLIPITVLPYWDLDATLREIERCAALGHRGVAFTQDPSYFGLPTLDDPHWDPMWACAQDADLAINFHVATADISLVGSGRPENGRHANMASTGQSLFLANARTIAIIICGGICHRFPNLRFVSVESGVGWLPFVVDSLDWQWKNAGVHEEHPEYDLLPSEYFKRQIYGCFWMEDATAHFAIEHLGADNILFETDFPHPMSMAPGPASYATRPNDYLKSTFANLDEGTLRKILHDNAAAIYHLD
jgi:predicted TIM-barrel fold metal-dependent hydrolase